jgi:hypothetical protein
MLTDPREIEIISHARQKNVRDPRRSRDHFTRIFEDFLGGVPFSDTGVLDLGPGQWDFGVLARERGAGVWGVDNDPAVVELGRHKGFHSLHGDLKRLSPASWNGDIADAPPIPFDGVFCKFSINAFWFVEDEPALRAHVSKVASLLADPGWAWIAPWNGPPRRVELTEGVISRVLTVQDEAFRSEGFDVIPLSEAQAKHYGVHGAIANRVVFVRSLPSVCLADVG